MSDQKKHFKKQDLEERSALFAEVVIGLVQRLPHTSINKRLIEQIVGASGSIGANYCEAQEAESKKDFIHKIGICKKEIRETKHWLRLLATANPTVTTELRQLWTEAHQLLLIFSKILVTARKNNQ